MRLIEPVRSFATVVAAVFCAAGLASAQCPAPDSFEPNQDCAGAVTLATGTYNSLTVMGLTSPGGADEDFYEVHLLAGEVVNVDCLFSHSTGDVDIFLYDLATSPNCGGDMFADFLVGSWSVTDDENVSYVNPTAVARTIIVRVKIYASDACANYDLIIDTLPDPCAALPDDGFEANDSCASAAALSDGLHSGLFVSATDADFYAIDVPAGYVLTVDASYVAGVDADPDLYLYSDQSCSIELDEDEAFFGSARVIAANPGASAATFVLEVRVDMGDGCNDYELNVVTLPDPCISSVDDAFEPNDDCSSATALSMGLHAGLYVSDAAPDYFTIDVPIGELLTVDLSYSFGVNADLDLFLYDDLACTNEVESDDGENGVGQVRWSNSTGAVATIVLEVRVAPGGGCNNYDLDLWTVLDPCLDPSSDDAFEDNDSCAAALVMIDGSYPGMFVSKTDHDYFEVRVAAGDTLFVDLLFTHATADVDVYLFDDPVPCDTLSGYLKRGYTSTNNEHMVWTNSTGSTQIYYVKVVVYWNSDGECNDYELQLSGSGSVLATPSCFGDGTTDVGGGLVGCPCGNQSAIGAGEGCASSLGYGATLTASGTSTVANDDLVFSISQARASQPSMLIQGSALVAFPFRDGILCTGTPTERVEVVFLDAAGGGSTVGSIVTNGNVSPGDTRHYQQWYRDPGGISPCGNGSNFTQALMLTWM